MTYLEALEQFREKSFSPMLEQALAKAAAGCEAGRDRLAEEWQKSMRDVVTNMEKNEFPFSPAYLVYTYLRTDLLEGRYGYRIYLYDKKWYFGVSPVEIGLLVPGDVFACWGGLWGKLLTESKRYVGKVSGADVRNLALSAAQPFSDLYAGFVARVEKDQPSIRPDGIKIYCGELMGELFEVSV